MEQNSRWDAGQEWRRRQFLRVDMETYLPPAYLERRAVGQLEKLPVAGSLCFACSFLERAGFYFMKNTVYSVAILCGGKSRRMGQDKAGLSIEGTTFLEKLVENYSGEHTGEILLSVKDKKDYPQIPVRHIEDLKPGMGPLMGLYSVLEESKNEAIWVTSCDMPLTDRKLAGSFYGYLTDGIDAVIPVDREGKKYVLCAWYRRSAKKVIKEQLDKGNLKVQHLLERLRVCYVAVEGIPEEKKKFRNVNTMEDYQNLIKEQCEIEQKKIPVLSFVAYSGTGKTTFLERLIPELKERGLKVAIVKHDGHQFEIDHEGKDTDRFTKAGADITGLVSSEKAVLMENRSVPPETFLSRIEGVDLILTEGFKKEKWPKIMLHRKATGKPLPRKPEDCLAVISDTAVEGARRMFGPEDTKGVAEYLVDWMKKSGQKNIEKI